MENLRWLTVARSSEIKSGEMRRFEIGRRAVAVANVEGQFYAFNDTCPHEDFSLSEGELEGCRITCALHAWSFDLRNGHPYPPLLQPFLIRYPVRTLENLIQISLSPI